MKYSDFKNSPYYSEGFSRENVEFLFYDSEMNPLPITKGENMTWAAQIEQFEVDEWGKTVIDEYLQGKYRISGTIGFFYAPKAVDQFPTSQNFVGVTFNVLMKVADNHPAAGTILGMLENVVLNARDLTATRGPVKHDVRFMASREYNGQEVETLKYLEG